MSTFIYPLDVTGSALSNRVRGEYQTLQPPTQSDNFHFILPRSGPYYRDTLKITHVPTGRRLIRGIDWEPGHFFHSASDETEHVKGGIYQSILFLDRTLSGQVSLDEYFVLGDHWSLDENKILEILSNKLWDPRITTYELVSGKPEIFPPIGHMHPAGDLVGMREQVEATYQVSAAIREQTQALPGKLELVLEDYYNAGDMDDLLLGLSEQLIGGIAGPQIEAMLRDVVASMITNYYTKSQVNTLLANVVQSINALYTNAQIDSKLAPLASTTYVDNAVSDKVDISTFESALENVTGGAIYQGDLDDLANRMSSVDVNLQDQIDVITQLTASLGGDMSRYVTKDEFLELIPDRKYDSSYYLPGTIDVPSTEDGDVDNAHYINAEILSHTKTDGKISAIEFMIHEGRTVKISVDDTYSDVEDVPAMLNVLQLIDDGAGDVQLAGHVLYLSYSFKMDADGIVSDQEWTISVRDVERDIIDFKLTDMELSERFDGAVRTSTASEIAIGYVDVTGSIPVWIPFINALGHTRIERKTVAISKANALAGNKITVEFSRDNGHRCTSQVSSCLLKDPSGNSIPTHGVRHLYRDMLWNTVVVDIPKVDLSSYSGTPTLTLEVEVTTKTLR